MPAVLCRAETGGCGLTKDLHQWVQHEQCWGAPSPTSAECVLYQHSIFVLVILLCRPDLLMATSQINHSLRKCTMCVHSAVPHRSLTLMELSCVYQCRSCFIYYLCHLTLVNQITVIYMYIVTIFTCQCVLYQPAITEYTVQRSLIIVKQVLICNEYAGNVCLAIAA